MTAEQVEDYMAGYAYNEQFGDKKNWGWYEDWRYTGPNW
jgi:hypothetical protein